MKVLVFSDSHSNIENIKKAINMFENEVEFIVHLGDYVDDVKNLKSLYKNKTFLQVAGNNDFTRIDNEKIININKHKVFITHGHEYNVYFGIDRLYYRLNELGVNTALYGHTHKPLAFSENNILILNPGSISLPRSFNICTFLLLDFLENIKYTFYGIIENNIKDITYKVIK